MKMVLSLIVWAVLWEIAGRLKLSTIVPPSSRGPNRHLSLSESPFLQGMDDF